MLSKLDVHFEKVVESLKKENLVPFVGAGASIASSPRSISWGTLAEQLAKELELDKCDHNPIDIIQYYDNVHGRENLNRKVMQFISPNKEDKKPNLTIQKQICSWPVETIVTTNYDDFLEKACDELDLEYTIIHPDNLQRWNDANGIKIFKMHGDIENNMILTQKDYQEYTHNHPGSYHLLQNLLFTKYMLFIGCSLTDPNFRSTYFRVRSQLLRVKNKHYAFFRPQESDEASMWYHFGINTILLKDKEKNKEIKLVDKLKEITNRCRIHAEDVDDRKNIFDNFEKIYLMQNEDLSKLTIRKETALGFICIPDDEKINIYDKFNESTSKIKKRAKNARERKKTYVQYIENGANVKIIVSVNPSRLEERGYQDHKIDMLTGLREFIDKYKDEPNFQIIKRGTDIEYSNVTMYDRDSLIVSKPLRSVYGVKDRLDVELNSKIISHTIRMFDERFKFYQIENLNDLKQKGVLSKEVSKILELEKEKESQEKNLTNKLERKLRRTIEENIEEINEKLDALYIPTINRYVMHEIDVELGNKQPSKIKKQYKKNQISSTANKKS